jgi:hypothetical protein
VFRRFIAGAAGFGGHLLRAAVIPYAGCVVYLSLWNGALWAEQLLHGGLANLHDTISSYAMGLLTALFHFYVVVPYGLVCQYAMHGRAEPGASHLVPPVTSP